MTRSLGIKLAVLSAVVLGGCDFWPRELGPLAESITRQVSGETTAWLVGGDVVVIDVAGSPLYQEEETALAAVAGDLAGQAIEFVGTPLESIVIAFHEGDATGDEQRTREFIFLVMEDRPVLQPYIDVDATGPLTSVELRAAVDRLGESPPGEGRECIMREAEQRARLLGDPDTLDPAKVEFLSAETWRALDTLGAEKRIFLAQAIATEALFSCVGR